VADSRSQDRSLRERLDRRAIWVSGIIVAAVIATALVFATNGFAGFDFRPAGGSGGGAPRLVSVVASHLG
jgi:hypothetical protein